MADKYAPEASHSFRYAGFMVITDPTVKHVEDPGRADLKLLRGGQGVCVEVKNGTTKNGYAGYDMKEWRENQREWAREFCINPPFSTEYWLWVAIGAHPPHYNPEKYAPRKTWLMPAHFYLEVERLISVVQTTIPYKVRPGLSRMIQEQKWDAITLFQPYELTWNGVGSLTMPPWFKQTAGKPNEKGIWTVPENHEFYKFIRSKDMTQNEYHQPFVAGTGAA